METTLRTTQRLLPEPTKLVHAVAVRLMASESLQTGLKARGATGDALKAHFVEGDRPPSPPDRFLTVRCVMPRGGVRPRPGGYLSLDVQVMSEIGLGPSHYELVHERLQTEVHALLSTARLGVEGHAMTDRLMLAGMMPESKYAPDTDATYRTATYTTTIKRTEP